MKFCFLSLMNGSYWGGSEELWFRLSLWMAREKNEVTVICYDWEQKKEKLDQLRNAGAMVHLMPRKRSFFSRLTIKRILKKIDWEDQEMVLINQGGYKEVVYAPFNDLHKRMKKYILTFHNYDETENLSSARRNSLEQWMNHAAINAGAAGKIFEVIEKNFQIPCDRSQVWPNPVTIEPPLTNTNYPPISEDSVHWSVLAELDIHRKAQDLLIDVLSAPKWKERNWVLHLYGRGKDEQRLRQLIDQHQLEHKVILEGFQQDIPRILQQTHVLIQCTRIDAMPLSVVEAMAMSRPCLVSSVGEMPAWIENGINGWVCDNIAMETLDRSLEQCWNDRNKWEQMGVKAYERFREKYPIPYEEEIFSRLRSIS